MSDQAGGVAESSSAQAPPPDSAATVPRPSRSADAGSDADTRLPHTRIGAVWAAIIAAVVLGVALVDFIVQNTRSVRIEFFAANGHVPVAVALLAAALAGAFVVLMVGVARTSQLRLILRRRSRRSRHRAGANSASNDASS